MRGMIRVALATVIGSTLFLASANATDGTTENDRPKPPPREDGPGPGGRRPHRRPPPEALAACQGKAKSAACTFQNPQGETMSGKCDAPREDLPLACRPDRPPPRPEER